MKKLSARNPWLLVAAIVMFLTALIHIFAGGMDIYDPLRNSGLALKPKATLSVVWHMVSLVLALFAGALFWLSKDYNRPLACFIGLSQLCFALLFIGYAIFDAGDFVTLPQWVVFALGVVMMWFGNRKEA